MKASWDETLLTTVLRKCKHGLIYSAVAGTAYVKITKKEEESLVYSDDNFDNANKRCLKLKEFN